jgi:hypothetical protein
MNKQLLQTVFIVCFLLCCYKGNTQTRIYVSDSDKYIVLRKIENESWAKEAYKNIELRIDKYADRHQEDPDWIISRLAMYWKDGERYTQCYLKNQNWDYGTGNAPVPTLRLPGMRTWNQFYNVPLEDRIPYNETGDMLGLSRSNPELPPILVPYKESGHMIRGNNVEILTLAEEASFLYWISRNEKYARFASDIFYTWLMGIYYMNPILDPEQSTGGPGGWEPGGICGYYDYEQIHDDMAMHAAVIYDFMYDYLNNNQHPHLREIKKPLKNITGEVFKRFIGIGFVRGGKSGNWNVNGWNMILKPILVLDKNDAYEDGKGREYYLHYLLKESTSHHDAIPDILKSYDSITGLWPESPGYAFGTIDMLLDFAIMLQSTNIDIIGDNTIMQKAALAVFPWMDDQANMIVFGDTRGGPANFRTFENLLSYYTKINDKDGIELVSAALNKGIKTGKYDRTKATWYNICTYTPTIPQVRETSSERSSYSQHHRMITMKNYNGDNKLMALLYGGRKGFHLSENGLAVQFYGKGWALAPDAAGYESYWSKDVSYHQGVTGSNTILPGYKVGDITINAMDPMVVSSSEFTNKNTTSPNYSFTDISAEEKRRLIAMVRISAITGYYVDIFRSDQPDNDYLYHNLGNAMTLYDAKGNMIQQESANDLDTVYSTAYSYFDNIKKSMYSGDFRAVWDIATVSPSIKMEMWMIGQKNRTIYTMDAPPTTLLNNITPGGVNKSPQSTPSLIVRQNNNNAEDHPFIGVFEPYNEGEKSVQKVTGLSVQGDFISLLVETKDNRQYICNSISEKIHSPVKGISFKGIFGIISVNKKGFEALYLGRGSSICYGKYKIESLGGNVSAELRIDNGIYYYSSDSPIKITINNKMREMPAGYNVKLNGF